MAITPAHDLTDDEQEQMQIMSLLNLMMVESNDADATDDDDAGLEEEGVAAVAQQAVERMAKEEETIQRALSSSSRMPGEEDDDDELRAEAVRVAVLRADAEEVAVATRRLMETDLRRLAADAETGNYSYILILSHEELALAARTGDGQLAVHMEDWMASLTARLNRGAAEFASRPGEEAFVTAMRKEAAKADES